MSDKKYLDDAGLTRMWTQVKSFLSSNYATKSSLSSLQTTVNDKATKATTLAGYGITDAYTKTQIDGLGHMKLTKGTGSSIPSLSVNQFYVFYGKTINGSIKLPSGGNYYCNAPTKGGYFSGGSVLLSSDESVAGGYIIIRIS